MLLVKAREAVIIASAFFGLMFNAWANSFFASAGSSLRRHKAAVA